MDIFPFDWCDISKKDEVWENWLKCRRKIDKFYKKLRMERYSDICYEDRTNHKIAKLNKVLDEYVKKYSDNEQKTGIILGIEQLTPQSFHEPICYNQNSMFPLIKMEFENVEHYIPNDYDRILTEYYGNYMMFPQEMILRHNKQINLSEVLALHDRLHTGEGR
ncbi:MAG: LicD family protein [Candidatus Gastranaerophilales bacterium]|nr:LicD family protein [Candidatus Gastranaerophilales bacterium]